MITFLNVPFAEKDKAKRLGARWNSARKQWFIENVEDISEFMRWMPGHLKSANHSAKTKHQKKPAPAGRRLHEVGKKITGEHYFDTQCGCIPWEYCASCQVKVDRAGWLGAEENDAAAHNEMLRILGMAT